MKISIYLASGLLVVGLLVGVGFGYYLTPEYRSSMYDKGDMSLGPADKNFDLRYIDSMIAHHRGAMLLAQQLGDNTTRGEMKSLSQAILADEPKAISELYKWKSEWYGNTKKVDDPVVPNLGTYDDKFDLRFLNAIIAHHEAGIEMTQETKTKSTRLQILNNADAVETFLANGLASLKALRLAWYNI